MTRYRFDKGKGEVIEVTSNDTRDYLQIIPDIEPYKSMIDGSRITSRSVHRSHLKAHGCEEVGTETMQTIKTPLDRESRRAVIREQLRGMSDSRASEIMQQLDNQFRR